MSLRTVKYLSCDYCLRRWVRLEGGDPWPQGWVVPLTADGKYACPDCWKCAGLISPQKYTTFTVDGDPAAFTAVIDPKFLAPHVPTTHGCERFIVGEAADDTGDA